MNEALARILKQPYAKGNHQKANEVLQLLEWTERGEIIPVNPSQKGLGAINRDNVTCWLDSLLFAMFGRLNKFEPMLVRKQDSLPKQRLAMMLRLWVNLLRSGKLITTDIVSLDVSNRPLQLC